jgi:putative DNA primase/helicase
MSGPVERVLARLGERECNPKGNAAKGWDARCPAHQPDRNASFHLGAGDDGRALVFCHKGCSLGEIASALDMPVGDLFEGGSRNGKRDGRREIVESYPYVDEAGEVLYEVVRFDPKGFAVRRPDGSWGMKGVKRVLYRLPRVLAAVKAGEEVWVPEGERDVHALERAGVVATCNPGGAGKGKWRPEYAETLRGARVALIADKDDTGRAHTQTIYDSLQGAAKVVRIVEAATGKDASDHLAAGHTLDDFKPVGEGRPTTRASDMSKERLQWLWRGRLALGYLAVWCGAGDIGKSLFATWTIARLTYGELPGRCFGQPQSALIVSTEDGKRDMWLPRLEASGADLDRVEFLNYPDGWNVRDGIDWIDRAITGTDIRLAFVDALMSHMPEARGSENTRSPTFVRQALTPLAKLCDAQKVTGLFGLHPRKAGGDTFADVVQESGVFTQLPRIGLLFGYHPDDLELPRDQQRRVMLRGKGNIGRDPGALSFRIAEKFLDWDDGEPVNPEEDGVPYITDVEPCHVTERQLLGAKLDDRPMSKTDQAAALIGMALRDGEWHPAAPIREELEKAGLNHNATVDRAKRKVRVKSSKQEGVIDGPWGWQISVSSNSTPDPDSSARAQEVSISRTVPPENTLFPNEDRKSQRVSGSVRNGDEDGEERRRVKSQPDPLRAGARGSGTEPEEPPLDNGAFAEKIAEAERKLREEAGDA